MSQASKTPGNPMDKSTKKLAQDPPGTARILADALRVLEWSGLNETQRQAVLARPEAGQPDIATEVAAILADVRARGDIALREWTQRLDGIDLPEPEVPAVVLDGAAARVDPALLAAIDNAIGRVRAFHAAGQSRGVRLETAPGLICETVYRPIDPVGLYVPGGSAPLISTVIMLAVPAALAGCRNVVLCSPPARDGSLHPALLATAARCGIRRVIRAGGAQAIAALGSGTASLPACAKLFGPGNAWVTEAKRQVSAMPGGPAQDLPAGPSEVLVIADAQADPQAVAWDLLAQSEHGPDSQALLLSDSQKLLEAVAGLLPGLAASLPRVSILQQSLRNLRLVRCATLAEAVNISNQYAPEHLILNTVEAEALAAAVTATGSLFLGPWTPESLGDYSSGTNHVLPTYGYARAYSGLSVADFQRRISVQRADRAALGVAGADAMLMAMAEGLEAHRMAVAARLTPRRAAPAAETSA